MRVCCPVYRPHACMCAMCVYHMPSGCQCCQSPACMIVRCTEHLPACCQAYQTHACNAVMLTEHLPALLPCLPNTCLPDCPAYQSHATTLSVIAKRAASLCPAYQAPAVRPVEPHDKCYSVHDSGIDWPPNNLVHVYYHSCAGLSGTFSAACNCAQAELSPSSLWLLPAPGQLPATAHTAMAELPTGPELI